MFGRLLATIIRGWDEPLFFDLLFELALVFFEVSNFPLDTEFFLEIVGVRIRDKLINIELFLAASIDGFLFTQVIT